jgi:tRNA (guanine37-N1)-methyltransferase
MVLIDCVCRHIPGVLSSEESLIEESFNENLLEYPQYTRPEEFMGLKVPDVLLSGNHKEIEKWRRQKSLEITRKNRPDMLKGE